MEATKPILTLGDLIEAAGGDQRASVLEVYDEAWNLYRVESVEPDVMDAEDLAQVTGKPEDGEKEDITFSLVMRLVLVKRNRPY